MKAIVGVGVLVVAIIGLIVWGVRDVRVESAPLDPSRTIYFYGEGCPHCERVNEFLEANKVAEKTTFEKLEVWRDRANARLLDKAATACGLASSEVGVPFVYAEGRCLVGEPDVTRFFKERAGIE